MATIPNNNESSLSSKDQAELQHRFPQASCNRCDDILVVAMYLMDLQAVQLIESLTVGRGVPLFSVPHCPSHLTVGHGSIVPVIFTVGRGTYCSA